MTWNKGDFCARSIFKDDLRGFVGFCPSSFDGDAILEDVGFAGADRGDVFVVIVGGAFFLNHHGDDDFGCELGGLAASEFGGDFAGFFCTIVGKVRVARSVGTGIGVGFWVVGVNWGKVGGAGIIKGNFGDFWNESVDGFGGGGVDIKRVGGEGGDARFFGIFGGFSCEAFGV